MPLVLLCCCAVVPLCRCAVVPLVPLVLRRCFAERDYSLLSEGSVSNPYRQMRSLRKLGCRLLAHALSLFSATPRALRGEVYLGVWRRP